MADLTPPITANDHSQGLEHAPVTLVEYGDFQCPDCGIAYDIVRQLQAQFGNRLRFVFREFPLTDLHRHAEAAAEAAEAAGAQGKFWEMHDLLFQHQRALRDQDLQAYAVQAGLSIGQFAQDLSDHSYAARVHADLVSGVCSGVQGTPTFFINGARHDDSYDVETLAAAISRASQ